MSLSIIKRLDLDIAIILTDQCERSRDAARERARSGPFALIWSRWAESFNLRLTSLRRIVGRLEGEKAKREAGYAWNGPTHPAAI